MNPDQRFAIALDGYEENPVVDMEKMEKWRFALREMGRISGWNIHDRYHLYIFILFFVFVKIYQVGYLRKVINFSNYFIDIYFALL